MDLQLPKQSMPITTKVESSNLAHGELYSVQHYVIKFVSDLRKVSGFLKFPPPNKLSLSIKTTTAPFTIGKFDINEHVML
jgi:hypothetical protein